MGKPDYPLGNRPFADMVWRGFGREMAGASFRWHIHIVRFLPAEGLHGGPVQQMSYI